MFFITAVPWDKQRVNFYNIKRVVIVIKKTTMAYCTLDMALFKTIAVELFNNHVCHSPISVYVLENYTGSEEDILNNVHMIWFTYDETKRAYVKLQSFRKGVTVTLHNPSNDLLVIVLIQKEVLKGQEPFDTDGILNQFTSCLKNTFLK